MNIKRAIFSVVVLLSAYVMVVQAVYAAQTDSKVKYWTMFGTIENSRGAVFTVIARNSKTKSEYLTESKDKGTFYFSALPAGLYTIEPRKTSLVRFRPDQRLVKLDEVLTGIDFLAIWRK